jgi:hypothetical protein
MNTPERPAVRRIICRKGRLYTGPQLPVIGFRSDVLPKRLPVRSGVAAGRAILMKTQESPDDMPVMFALTSGPPGPGLRRSRTPRSPLGRRRGCPAGPGGVGGEPRRNALSVKKQRRVSGWSVDRSRASGRTVSSVNQG